MASSTSILSHDSIPKFSANKSPRNMLLQINFTGRERTRSSIEHSTATNAFTFSEEFKDPSYDHVSCSRP
jgi:hypothetical protein